MLRTSENNENIYCDELFIIVRDNSKNGDKTSFCMTFHLLQRIENNQKISLIQMKYAFKRIMFHLKEKYFYIIE